MILKDICFSTPQENILFDEVLLSLAEQGKGGEVFRLWESPRLFIVLGRTGKVQDEINSEKVKKDRVPVLRRFSGGGTVLQGKGCLNYAWVLPKSISPQLQDISASYRYVLGKIRNVIKSLGHDVIVKPLSDLALAEGERKFSGNAQHRGKKYILHHGTILYDFDLSLISRYLKVPQRMPLYRQDRSHEDFLTCLGGSADKLKQAFCEHFKFDRLVDAMGFEENNTIELLSSNLRKSLILKDF